MNNKRNVISDVT